MVGLRLKGRSVRPYDTQGGDDVNFMACQSAGIGARPTSIMRDAGLLEYFKAGEWGYRT